MDVITTVIMSTIAIHSNTPGIPFVEVVLYFQLG